MKSYPTHLIAGCPAAAPTLGTLLGLWIAMAPAPVGANGPEVGRNGSTVFPIQSRQVRLLREEVHADLPEGGSRGNVYAGYVLYNPGEGEVAFDMGFIMGPEDGGPGHTGDWELTVSGPDRELPVRWAAARPGDWQSLVSPVPDSLPTWHVSIAPGETLKLSINYSVAWSGGADGRDWGINFTYYAKPARFWAGPIELAEFSISPGHPEIFRNHDPWSNPCNRVTIEPAGSFWDGDRLTWRFEQWEPDVDIHIAADCVEPLTMADFVEPARLGDTSGRVRRVIELPDYECDHHVFGRPELLEEIRAAFLHGPLVAPTDRTLLNYTAFAEAYLLLRRFEIAARHGEALIDPRTERYFNSYAWYAPARRAPIPHLTPEEADNQRLMRELAREIAEDRGVLLSLSEGE